MGAQRAQAGNRGNFGAVGVLARIDVRHQPAVT